MNKTELRNFHPALQKWLIDHDVQANILTGITKAQGGNRTVQELKNGKQEAAGVLKNTRAGWRGAVDGDDNVIKTHSKLEHICMFS